MAFNPTIINTNVPPPNYPPLPMGFSVHQTNPCPTPPIPQQHMFNNRMHVPVPNPSPSMFNAVTSNHLPPPSPSVGLGIMHNPMQTPPPMWNNNGLNTSMANGQNQNYPSAPTLPQFPQNIQTTRSFLSPPPIPDKQFQGSGWNNSINNPPNNHIGLLTIAPNVSTGNNPINFNNHAPVPNFPHCKPQFNMNNGGNASVWSNKNFSNDETYKQPPPFNQMLLNGNQNLLNGNSDSNAFSHENLRNSIQKTNVPDSSIFQNPNAIFSMTRNTETLNPPVNAINQNTFQNYNFNNNGPLKHPNMIPVNQGEESNSCYKNSNSCHQNYVENATNYNNFSNKHNQYFDDSSEFSNKYSKSFNPTKIKDNNVLNNNFRSMKSNFSNGQSLSQHNNQNLIDVRALPNNNVEGNLLNQYSFGYNNYKLNSSSTVVEEFTISDSESVESISNKNSQKYQRNKRGFENLQSINSSCEKNVENKMVWMTESIQKALQKRNMLFKQARTTNDPAVWNEYTRLKEEINEEIRQSKLNSKNNRPRRNIPKVWQNKEKKLPFNCDTCDRGFSSKDELDLHLGLHIKCDFSDCNFEAHPKIVSLHQKMQHDTGYADVINKLQNDEEIKKWREERKRRFPTAENILKKKAEQAEKEARGEVIEEKQHGEFKRRKFEDRNTNRPFNRQNRNNRRRRHRNAFQKAPEIDLAQESDSEEETEYLTKLPKFRGMKKGLDYLLDNKIEEMASSVKIEERENDPIQTSEASSNQNYNHPDMKELNDDDDDAPLEIPIQKVSLNESSDSADENEKGPLGTKDQQELLNEVAVKDSPSTAPNGDEKPDNNVKSSIPSKNYKGKGRDRNERKCHPPIPPRPKNSLLRMLLSDEIRHERNVIMQCVRHIVENNFFGVGANA